MFRVPTDIKAGKAITINGQAYNKDARIEVDDLATIAKRLHVYLSKGLLYASPDPHGRKVGRTKRVPVFLPPVMLNATLAQELVQDAPAAPTAATAAFASTTTVEVSFTPGAAGASPITNYEYRVGTAAWTALDPVDTSSPVTVPVAAGAAGSLRIRAVSLIGKGAQSDAIAYSVAVPAAPTALVATPGHESASIAFTAGAAGGSAITDYEYRVDEGVWTSAATIVSPVVISGLTNDVEVSIELRAVSAVGDGVASAAVLVTPAVQLPAAPTALVATPSALAVSIAFVAPDMGGGTIVEYQHSFNDGVDWFGTTPDTVASPYDMTLPADDYTVVLRAVNEAGEGPASAPVTFTVPGA